VSPERPKRARRPTRIEVAAQTDVGSVRSQNEDSFLVGDQLFAVADGMGGHAAGEVASALALKTLAGVSVDKAGAVEGLLERFREAHRRIRERGEAEDRLRGMGTTLTAIIADDEQAHVVHIGDSRAYRYRDGVLEQLTTDDSLVQFLVGKGRLSPEEARKHPSRSILTRALGVGTEAEFQAVTLDIQLGDRLVLCTDGLSTFVSRDQIESILHRIPDPRAACDALIRRANEVGGDDNITVIVADIVRGSG
jgi:PPM family protein phosphatase